MTRTLGPGRPTPSTTSATATQRADTSAAVSLYARPYPRINTARRVAALASRLPGADPAGPSRLRHVEAAAAALNWSDDTRAAQIWRLVDWQAVRVSLGRTRGWTASHIERLPPDELADALEELVDSNSAA
jgi:hypothetical protein